MNGQSYFQLISPLIFIVFATGFYMIYRYSRELVSARIFALSYLIGTIAFLLDFLRNVYPEYLSHMGSNTFYMLTAVTFSAGLIFHYKKPIPFRPLLLLFGIGISLSAWFTYVDDSISLRVLTINLLTCFIFAYPLYALWDMPKRKIDRIVLWMLCFLIFQFAARAVLVTWYEGASLTAENWAGSLSAITLQFTSSIAALFMAMALFILFGMEIILRLRQTSETDLLTGIWNRRGVDERLPAFEKGLQEGVQSHGIVVIDVDHFKSVNDVYGHDVGDTVLVSCAKVLAKLETENSVVARMGGEEFCLILFNANAASAKLAAEYARSVITAQPHASMDNKNVTISAGVSLWTADQAFGDALREADRALYEAKAAGRDCVRLAQETAQENMPHKALST